MVGLTDAFALVWMCMVYMHLGFPTHVPKHGSDLSIHWFARVGASSIGTIMGKMNRYEENIMMDGKKMRKRVWLSNKGKRI